MHPPRPILLVLLVAACGSGNSVTSSPPPPPPAAVASVTLSQAAAMLAPTQTVTLVATTKDATGTTLTGRTITWNSSAATVATVSTAGLVTGIATGTAIITATSEGQSGSATITVADLIVPVASVVLNQLAASLVPLQTLMLVATAKDASGNALAGRGITWSSTATSTATVDGNGVVTGVAAGSATITATSEGKTASATITVTPGAFLGPAGGTAMGFSGNATVTVPAGALSAALAITISQVANPQADPKLAAGTAYDFGPTGTTFSSPVTLAIKYDPATLAGGTNQAQLRVHKLVGTTWTPLAGSTVNTTTHVVTGATSSFSTYAVLEVPIPVALTSVSPILALATGVPFTATVNGSGFVTGSVVQWNGQARSTTVVSATQLTAQITAADIATAGTGQVTVQVPGANGGTTSALPITVVGPAQAVSAGGVLSCAIGSTKALYCWGDNRFGYLGDGSAAQVRPTPVPVGIGLAFSTVTLGDGGSCGLATGGALYCWGTSDGIANSSTPVHVATSLTFASVSRGANDVCGITVGGSTYCWGSNGYGQDGTGTIGTNGTPALVTGGLTFVTVSVGVNQSCGLIASGAAYCWGHNDAGEPGRGDLLDSSTPALVAGGHTFVAIVAGNPSCGITGSGSVYCWGSNATGAFGNGNTVNSSTPVLAANGMSFVSLSVYSDPYGSTDSPYACGVTPAAAAYCWGANIGGALGDGQEGSSLVPMPVAGGQTFSAVSVGNTHACGITVSGTAECWGQRSYGHLGDGFVGYRNTPTPVVGGLVFSSLSIGSSHICGLAGGDVWCWGDGSNGQLGNGADVSSAVPVKVAGGHNFIRLGHSNSQVTCAVATDTAPPLTKTYCWGNNVGTSLGDGTSEGSDHVPVVVAGSLDFASLSSGAFNPVLIGATTCGITTSGAGYCWGYNGTGQIGDGTQLSRSTPTPISGGMMWRSIAVGDSHACGFIVGSTDGYCWGDNQQGQLGQGTFGGGNRLTPHLASNGASLTGISAGFATTCTVDINHQGVCWGNQIPTGVGVGSEPYGLVIPGSYFSIQLGGSFGCGLTTTSSVMCWGWGNEGELGNGVFQTTIGAKDLTAVVGAPAFQSIYAGSYVACGLAAGQAYCWGDNSYGALGIGEADHVNQPIAVSGSITFLVSHRLVALPARPARRLAPVSGER